MNNKLTGKIWNALRRSNIVALIVNLFWIYVMYLLCRLIFIWENWNTFGATFGWDNAPTLFRGGFLFDTAGICYTNILFVVLFIIIGYFRKVPGWYNKLLRWLYVVVNGVFLLVNFADTIFFATRLQRSTMATLREFQGEGNLGTIAWVEIVSHWYLIVAAAIIIWGLWWLFLPARGRRWKTATMYVDYSFFFVAAIIMLFSGMRGFFLFRTVDRPISINYSFNYTTVPSETGIVLNTTFSILRTLNETTIRNPRYFTDPIAMAEIFSPVHGPSDSIPKEKNLVIMMMESFSKEFVGYFNKDLDGGTYKGYTPYLDAMIDSCLFYDETISNSSFSIDASPAVLASIPRAERPYVVSPFAMNHINSLASALSEKGYKTLFFHGAENGSLGIDAFVKQAGYQKYYGKDEFLADGRFGGMEEFDGTWGIWDEPFLQYFCGMLSETSQPFLATVFTLSSHHPFNVPEKYKNVFKDEGEFELYKAVKYSDYALHRFFEEASRKPWFDNTIFVITADHTNSRGSHSEYKNDIGPLRIPILIYDPSGELPRGRHPGIFQQMDIMPTMLHYLGYDKGFISFGKDMFATDPEDSWAFNWNSLPIYIKGDYLLVFDGQKPLRLYNYKADPDGNDNLLGKGLPQENEMLDAVKAIVQSYLERMIADDVTIKDKN